MLRQLFLDKPNRYLVFSSHIPLDVDPQASRFLQSSSHPASARECLVMDFSACLDVGLLRTMSPECSGLNPCEVAFYGGIPSLIYSVQTLYFNPQVRFRRKFCQGSLGKNSALFSLFVSSLYDGNLRPEFCPFEEFGILTPYSQITWPLCYIGCILSAFLLAPQTHFITSNINALSTHSSLIATGKDWECIINIALALHCHRYVLCNELGECIPRISDCTLDLTVEVAFCSLPGEYHTLDSAVHYITYRSDISQNSLIVLAPTYAAFPDFDLLVIRRTSAKNMIIYGYQIKLGRSYPKRDLPSGVACGYLIRGDPPQQSSLRRGWSYLGSDAIASLLDCSLRSMTPTHWPPIPSTADDCFDWSIPSCLCFFPDLSRRIISWYNLNCVESTWTFLSRIALKTHSQSVVFLIIKLLNVQ